MQSQNVNVLTKSLKFKQLDVKLQNPQNSIKFLMFFVKPQRREHCDSEIIHVTLNWIIKSIDSGDFLTKMMRKLFVYVYNVWCDQSRTLFKDRTHFSKNKNVDWNFVSEQFFECSRLFMNRFTARACLKRFLNWTWTYRSETSRIARSSIERYLRIHDVLNAILWRFFSTTLIYQYSLIKSILLKFFVISIMFKQFWIFDNE